MVPYFEQPSLTVGPLTFHAFGVIVAASVLIGLALGRRRFERIGVPPAGAERFGWYVIVGGFLGAHLFALGLYFPEQLRSDPFALLRLWEHLSSFGGILGGLLGVLLYLWRHGRAFTSRTRWMYLDVVAFVFAISLLIGRVACTIAHDHPGRITRLPVGISLHSESARAYITDVYAVAGRASELPPAAALADLAFHDLGWYELLYLAIVVVPVMMWLDRRPRPPGTFVAAFAGLYMPVRFALDFLRVGDATYAGLTPAQWVALPLLIFVPFALRRK